jgi:hypothetical protein
MVDWAKAEPTSRAAVAVEKRRVFMSGEWLYI